MDMLCKLLVCLNRHGDAFGEGKAWKMDLLFKLAVLDHSDRHFGRYNHAARCFRSGQDCLGPDQHSGKLPLRFVGPSVDGCSTDMCFSLQIGLLLAWYVKIAYSGLS